MRWLLAILALCGPGWLARPVPAVASCILPSVPPEETTYLGLAYAQRDASGRWTGRWLGAHPVACDGDGYVALIAAEPMTTLQRALSAQPSSGPLLLLGDVPYVGDGVCASGQLRRWWEPAPGDANSATWQPTEVPPDVPALSCPLSLPADGPLLLRPLNP